MIVRRRVLGILVATCIAAALAACAPTAQPPVIPEPRPSLSEEFYRTANARGEPVFRIDTARSLATVRTFRAGSLARLGHDHLIASRDLRGFVRLPRELHGARADLFLPLDTLSVDEPALRTRAGLTTTPTAADIDGTRTNMLVRTLDAEHHPYLALHLVHVAGELPSPTLDAEITLHGRTHHQPFAVQIDTASGELRVAGRFTLNQTDFGITPFSIFGGALQVADPVDVQFEILAVPQETGPPAGPGS
jgi:hypothetical protein